MMKWSDEHGILSQHIQRSPLWLIPKSLRCLPRYLINEAMIQRGFPRSIQVISVCDGRERLKEEPTHAQCLAAAVQSLDPGTDQHALG